MQTKNGKQYLPQTYQSYLALKKKTIKTNGHTKAISNVQNSARQNFYIEIPKQLKPPNKIKQIEDDQQNIVQKPIQIIQKTTYSDYQKMFDEFENCKFINISQKIKKEIERLKQYPPIRTISINTILKDLNIQSLQNIRNIQRQLKHIKGRRNMDKIDTMLAYNKFFIILNKQKRYKIYDNCQFIIVQQGQQIYKDGDIEDYMYVVIKGCVKQYQKKSTSFNQKITVNFISHYQGSNFGEAQLVGEKNQKAKRHHTAIAAQKSYLLKIDNQFYRDLITNSAQDDFQKKLGSLLSTSMFAETSKIFVTPLLSTLQKKILNFGDVLIKQGDQVRKLYFIGDGTLQIVFISRQKRSIKHLNIQEKPKNFYTRGNTAKKNERPKNYSIHNTFYYSKQEKQASKQFIYGKKKVIGNQLQYNDQILFQQLRQGHFLGGKSFLSREQRQSKADSSQYFTQNLHAKLSVISSSITTTVYSIDQKKFFSLSDNLQKVMIQGIMTNMYFDQRNIQSKVTAHQDWKNYSQHLVARVIKQKKQRNQSFRL